MGAEHVGPLEALPTWSSRSDPSSAPRPLVLDGQHEELHLLLVLRKSACHTRFVAGQAGYVVTTTSAGALLLMAVVSQLAAVLLSLPFKSLGWDLTAVPSVRVTAESTRTPSRGVTGGGPDDPFVATACASWMAAATRQAP